MRKDFIINCSYIDKGKEDEIKSNIQKIEQLYGIKFPSLYKHLVLKYFNFSVSLINKLGEEVEGSFYVKEKEDYYVFSLYNFLNKESDGKVTFYVEWIKELQDEYVPNLVIPFARGAGRDNLYFDFRVDRNNPIIKWGGSEEELINEDDLEDLHFMGIDLDKTLEEKQDEVLYVVANSFEEFLENLVALEHYDYLEYRHDDMRIVEVNISSNYVKEVALEIGSILDINVDINKIEKALENNKTRGREKGCIFLTDKDERKGIYIDCSSENRSKELRKLNSIFVKCLISEVEQVKSILNKWSKLPSEQFYFSSDEDIENWRNGMLGSLSSNNLY